MRPVSPPAAHPMGRGSVGFPGQRPPVQPSHPMSQPQPFMPMPQPFSPPGSSGYIPMMPAACASPFSGAFPVSKIDSVIETDCTWPLVVCDRSCIHGRSIYLWLNVVCFCVVAWMGAANSTNGKAILC